MLAAGAASPSFAQGSSSWGAGVAATGSQTYGGSQFYDALRRVSNNSRVHSMTEVPSEPRLVLEVTLKDGTTTEHTFGLRDVSVGSHRSCALQIKGLAPFHARIERDSRNNYWLRSLAMSCSCGTMLRLRGERVVTLKPNDIVHVGPNLELAVRHSYNFPKQSSLRWHKLGLLVLKTRGSLRYRQIKGPGMSYFHEAQFCVSNDDTEVLVGRKVFDCDFTVQDYEMPPLMATFGHGPLASFVNASTEAKKKGVFLEISDRRVDHASYDRVAEHPGRIHALKKGDVFRVGRCHLEVVTKRVESDKEADARVRENARAIQKSATFSNISEGEVNKLAASCCAIQFSARDHLLVQGEPVYGLYLLTEGRIEVFHSNEPDRVLTTHGPGSVVGERSLFTGHAATASIRASTNCRCLFIDCHSVRESIHPSKFGLIRVLCEHRFQQNVVHDLRAVPFLATEDEARHVVLASRVHRVMMDKGGVLVSRGDVVKTLFVVGSGIIVLGQEEDSAQVAPELIDNTGQQQQQQQQRHKRVFGGGYFFAEALESDFVSPYVVSACTTAELWGLHRKDVEEVLRMSSQELKAAVGIEMEKVDTKLLTELSESSGVNLIPMRRASLTTSSSSDQPGGFSIVPDGPSSSKGKQQGRSAKVQPEDAGQQRTQNDPSGAVLPSGARQRRSSASITLSEGEGSEGSTFYRTRASDATGSAEDDKDAFDPTVESALFAKANELERRLIGKKTDKEFDAELRGVPNCLVLKCVSGPQKKQVFVMTESVTIVGRWTVQPGTDKSTPFAGFKFISLNDRTVSRINSMISYYKGNYWLRDLGSTYGTHLKLEDDKDYGLELGSVVSCAFHEFVVHGDVEQEILTVKKQCCSLM
jgi:CRP-like cAMP-binding protein